MSFNILSRVLAKKKKSYTTLTKDEKIIYSRWEGILKKQKISIGELKSFLQEEVEKITQDLSMETSEYGSKMDRDMKSRLWWGRFILQIIEAPDKSAVQLEAYLKRFFKLDEDNE